MLNIPVLAIGHHPKVRALMNDLGLAGYCVDIQHCTFNVLKGRFEALVNDRAAIKSRMAERLACYRKSLDGQFDELFASVYSQGTRDDYVSAEARTQRDVRQSRV